MTEARARRILRARGQVEAFLGDCLAEVVKARPRVVGFTSIFQQHLASLALAKRIKATLPETTIVVGGANCEGIMGAETVRQFPFVDAVVSGEGEVAFPEIVERVLAGRAFADVAGVRTPERVAEELRSGSFSNALASASMDDLPYPDFTDFFEQFEATPYSKEWEAGLFFETSRGCWWGERNHCTFCGLNGTSMAFRSKSAARAVAELEQMVREHPGCDIQVVDNILDMGYFKDFLPALAEKRLRVDLFYETKSNLKKDQIRLLKKAGITRIQPGVESLSDSVLKVMRKGVSGLQNIQLLKWCKELGVEPHWNVLWGFPGEDPAEYARLAELVPHLTHLPAPVGFSDIRLDRFSPNFFDAETLGFKDIRPLPSYRHVYPTLSDEALGNLAYFFGFAYQEPRDVDGYVAPLVKELRAWTNAAARGDSDLFSVDLGEHLLVWDLRPKARQPLTVLTGIDKALYQSCDSAADVRALGESLRLRGITPVDHRSIGERLCAFASSGLAVNEGPRYLALAVPLGEYVPARKVLERFARVARSLGRPVAGRAQPLSSLGPADFVLSAGGDLLVRNVAYVTGVDKGGRYGEDEGFRKVGRIQEEEGASGDDWSSVTRDR